MVVVTALHNESTPNGGAETRNSRRTQRFRKSSRLRRHADFQRVYKQGRRQFAAHMTMFYLVREGGGGARVGLTVGRVLGGAVERNRIKRRLREAVRGNLAQLGAAIDVVINPKKSALTVDFETLKDEVVRAFGKIQSAIDGRQSTKATE